MEIHHKMQLKPNNLQNTKLKQFMAVTDVIHPWCDTLMNVQFWKHQKWTNYNIIVCLIELKLQNKHGLQNLILAEWDFCKNSSSPPDSPKAQFRPLMIARQDGYISPPFIFLGACLFTFHKLSPS